MAQLARRAIADVEFLQRPLQPLQRPLVYLYRSGVLRRSMIDLLRDLAARDGTLLGSCEPGELALFCVSGGLFSGPVICDWDKSHRVPFEEQNTRLEALGSAVNPEIAVFLNADDGLRSCPAWTRVEATCTIVEERWITPEELVGALTFLVGNSLVARGRAFLEQGGFLAYFQAFLRENDGAVGLAELRFEFDRAILLYADDETDEFQAVDKLTRQVSERSEIVRSLVQVIATGDKAFIPSVIRGLERRLHEHQPFRDAIDELIRCTLAILVRKPVRQAAGQQPSRERLIVWSALLLARWCRAVASGPVVSIRPSLTLIAVDSLLNEYLHRVSVSGETALSGLWSDLSQNPIDACDNDNWARTPVCKLVDTLRAYIDTVQDDARWISRVLYLLSDNDEVGSQAEHAGEGVGDSVPQRAKQLSAIIGHWAAVRGLKHRFISHQHSTPVILYGLQGVGRKTLARTYARALLCEERTGNESDSCGRCDACRAVDNENCLGLIEFDAGLIDAPQYVRGRLLDSLSKESFARRWVVIIHNPEMSPAVLDMCLKTIEEQRSNTTFIFTVSDPKSLSATLLSRCDQYQLRPLTDVEARSFVSGQLTQEAHFVDERVVDLVVAATRGLPAHISQACSDLVLNRVSTIRAARSALRLDWAEDAIAYWRQLLGDVPPDERFLQLPIGQNPTSVLNANQVLLREVYSVHHTGKVSEAAFLYLDGDPLRELATTINSRAGKLGRSFDELWRDLAEHWSGADQADHFGFFAAGLRSRFSVYPDRGGP